MVEMLVCPRLDVATCSNKGQLHCSLNHCLPASLASCARNKRRSAVVIKLSAVSLGLRRSNRLLALRHSDMPRQTARPHLRHVPAPPVIETRDAPARWLRPPVTPGRCDLSGQHRPRLHRLTPRPAVGPVQAIARSRTLVCLPPKPTRIRPIMALSGGIPFGTRNWRMPCRQRSTSRPYKSPRGALKALGLDLLRDQALDFFDVVLLLLL